MSAANELLESREAYYKNNVTLAKYAVFCGDDRPDLFPALNVHVFGGAANPAYNNDVLNIALRGQVAAANFKASVGEASEIFAAHQLRVGVHSDTHAETGSELDVNGAGEIGCGYIKLRRHISGLIAENPDKIVAAATELCPEFFTDPSDISFGHTIVKAHAALTGNDTYFGFSSREVASAAIETGAPSMLVNGSHEANQGIINKHEDSTIDSTAAFADDKPTYDEDSWASQQLLSMMPEASKADSRQREIAELIDTIGTMWALGVTEIAVRR